MIELRSLFSKTSRMLSMHFSLEVRKMSSLISLKIVPRVQNVAVWKLQ